MGAQRKALWKRQDLAPSPQGTFLQGPPWAPGLSAPTVSQEGEATKASG